MGRGRGGPGLTKHLISPCGTGDRRGAGAGCEGAERIHARPCSPTRRSNPEEDARRHTPLHSARSTQARAPPEVGVQRGGGGGCPGSPGPWDGATSSTDTLPRALPIPFQSEVRKAAHSGVGVGVRGGDAKCGRSHLGLSPPRRRRHGERGEGWRGGRPVAGVRWGGSREQFAGSGAGLGKSGGEGSGGVPTRSALPCPAAASAPRGGGGIARPHPRPGRSARLSPATAAAHAPCVAPATGGPSVSATGTAPARLGLPHLLPPRQLRLTRDPAPRPVAALGSRARPALAPAPPRPPGQSGPAPPRTSPPGPARRPPPPLGKGPAAGCQRVGAPDPPRPAPLPAARDRTWKQKGCAGGKRPQKQTLRGKGAPRSSEELGPVSCPTQTPARQAALWQ